MILIAVLFPWLSFFLRGKIIVGFLCLILQITLIGWLPAAIWAVASLLDGRNKRRVKEQYHKVHFV
ncbi:MULTISPECIES: YqaE/Pmp3 family membrane protein [Sphingobacterium]|uniref:YqaE/Pmp3 family membrane protein n=1 Tax=Sphingobacterium TaxID=28453 RepID=UPI00057B8741|nr:YqaE/Pmp3 family membrane protein [Sphingobacterium sp. T2]